MWNLAARIPGPRRYSRVYRGRREIIAHILVSRLVVHAVAFGGVTTGPEPASIGDDPGRPR